MLVERDREVAALKALVRDAAAGRAGVAALEGPAGTGTTRLVAEAGRWRWGQLSAPSPNAEQAWSERHPASAAGSSRREATPSLR